MKKNRFYIKGNIIFSDLSETIYIPQNIELFNFEDIKSKNIYIKNKTILENLEIILENLEKNKKEIKVSGYIKNFDEIKKKILELKDQKKLIKVDLEDYEYIEKTSQIEIIEQLLNSIDLSRLEKLKKVVNDYIKKISTDEKEKYSQLEEDLNIEKSKLNKIEKEKKDIEDINESLKIEISKSDKKISELVDRKKELTSDEEKDEKIVELNDKKDKILLKEEKIKFKIEDNKFEISIIENKIATIKDQIKMGNFKCFNWILMIITFGLIYWTKYSDCNYKINSLNYKKNRIKEKIAKLEKKENILKRDIEKINQKEENFIKIDLKKEFEIKKSLEQIEKKIKIEQKKIETNQEKIDENLKKIHKIDSKNEDNIKNRLIELKVLKEEYDKYSTKNIEKIVLKIENKIRTYIEKIENLKNNLEKQKIDIKDESICEFEN